MHNSKRLFPLGLYLTLALTVLVSVACGAASTATPPPAAATSAPPVAGTSPTSPPVTSRAPVPASAATQAPGAQPTAMAPSSMSGDTPRGTLVLSEFDYGTESWIPWEEVNNKFYWERVIETLVRLDPVTWEFLPGLAKSWDLSPDGQTLTYKLQEGVQFHDGWGEFTSEDAAFSLNEWLFNEESVHPSIAAQKQADPVVRVVDRHTVEVEYRASPFLTAVMDLSSGNNGVGMLSKAHIEKVTFDGARRNGIGTGPYRFVEHRLGESITVEATEEEHWRITPQWQTLKFRVTPEPSTRLAQVLSGEADIAVLPGSFRRQTEAAGIRTLLNPGVAGVFLAPVVYVPGTTGIDAPDPNNPMADPLFREALSLAINRQEIADVIFSGGAVPTGNVDLAPISLGYASKFEEPDSYDPERAKELLAQSGKAGLTFKFDQRILGGVPEGPQVAEAVAGMWEAVGLTVDLTLNYQTSPHSDLRRTRALEGTIFLMRLGHLTDTTRRLVSQYRCTEEKTALFACNEELEALAPDILASTNLDEKDELIRRAYEIILGNRVVIPIVQTATVYALGPKVGQWQPRLGERFTTELESVGHAQ